MLDEIIDTTDIYLNSKTKKERKKIGQFFTSKETAIFMANLSKCNKENLKILDAGAGTGILSIALLERLNKIKQIKNIEIDLYENDLNIAEILDVNMKRAKNNFKKVNKYKIIKENFILYNSNCPNEKYDIIISNPPYKKIEKNSKEAITMKDVIYGQPNLYFLFMAKAERLLKENGEMIFIVPRSWTSGTYFKKFRNVFLSKVKLTNIHLFISRDKVFNKENVLQETMILRAIKTEKKQDKIEITESFSNNDFDKISKFLIDYNLCVDKDNEQYVYLPIDDTDIKILKTINTFDTKLEDIGLKLKTGLTVDFRNKRYLQDKPTNDSVPLFSSIHFKNGSIKFPNADDKEPQYININNKSLLQKNTNYLFIKRFSSKEEKRRIQPAMFFKNEFSNYEYISTENHINFISSLKNIEVNEDIIYGLYIIYNSTLYDRYYRILNGSTQVNATEINNIPIPDEKTIIKMGKKLQEENYLSTEICDNVLMEVINNEQT